MDIYYTLSIENILSISLEILQKIFNPKISESIFKKKNYFWRKPIFISDVSKTYYQKVQYQSQCSKARFKHSNLGRSFRSKNINSSTRLQFQ